MKLFGFEIGHSSTVAKMQQEIQKLQKHLALTRPELGSLQGVSAEHNLVIPFFKLHYVNLYHLARHSDVMMTITLGLRREIFRRGCKFSSIAEVDHGRSDEDSELMRPEQESNFEQHEMERVQSFWERANDNGQGVLDVCRSMEDDLNIVDDAYMLFLKEYTYMDGSIVKAKLRELLRVNPLYISPVADKTGRLGYQEDGQPVLVCPEHRTQIYHDPGQCPECGCDLHLAKYQYHPYGTGYDQAGGGTNAVMYYIDKEVVRVSKYTPGMLGGFPPLLSVWKKVSALMAMDIYIHDYYGRQRPPKGVLLINTRNRVSMEKAWEWLLEKSKTNPHIVWPFAIDSNSQRGTSGQFIDFMKSLQEQQFTESREEFRRVIGAVYGVMPIFQGDLSNAGGLNNEGLQVTVTNRAVESGQEVYNKKVFPKILDALGVEGLKVELLPSEERDEMAELQRKKEEITNAQLMLDMGFDVEFDEDTGKFRFSGSASRPMPQPQGFGFGETNDAESMGSSPEGFGKTYTAMHMQELDAVMKGRLPEASKDRTSAENSMLRSLQKELSALTEDIKLRKLSKREAKKKMHALIEKLAKNVKEEATKNIKEVYNKTTGLLEKELGLDIGFGEVDKNAIEVLSKNRNFTSAFANMDKEMTDRVNKTIAVAFSDPKKLSIESLTKELGEVIDLSKGALRRIARTETTKIANAARINGYKKADNGKFKFKWIGPSDQRTTGTCKVIKRRSDHGVGMKELLDIIQEEAQKADSGWSVQKDAPAAHVNCRHTIVRVV